MLECTSTSRLVTGAFVCWSSAGFNSATSGTDIVDAFLALDSFLCPEIKGYINIGVFIFCQLQEYNLCMEIEIVCVVTFFFNRMLPFYVY